VTKEFDELLKILLKEKKSILAHLDTQLKKASLIETIEPVSFEIYKSNFEKLSKSGTMLEKEFKDWLSSKFTKKEEIFRPETVGKERLIKEHPEPFIKLEVGKSRIGETDQVPRKSSTPKTSMSSAKLDVAVDSSINENQSKIFQSTPNQASVFSLMKTQDKSIEQIYLDPKPNKSTVFTPRNVEKMMSHIRPLFKTQTTFEQHELEVLSPLHKLKYPLVNSQKQKRQIKPSLQGDHSRKMAHTQRTTPSSFSGAIQRASTDKISSGYGSPIHSPADKLHASLVCIKEKVKF
jgi:hypothetical protein